MTSHRNASGAKAPSKKLPTSSTGRLTNPVQPTLLLTYMNPVISHIVVSDRPMNIRQSIFISGLGVV